jgi:zinc transporter ZupT
VSYVFVHLLPELAEGQETVAEALDEGRGPAFLQSHIYLVALLGLVVFYGLERLATSSRRRKRQASKEDSTSEGVFWLHISSFAVYNYLIGYLFLHRLATGLEDLLLFFVAMALHIVVNDHGLREHHKEAYLRGGHWILAAAVILGWVVALLTEIPEVIIAVLLAFLAGGVIMNVLKEELPEERESRFWAFALGAALYTAVLLAL